LTAKVTDRIKLADDQIIAVGLLTQRDVRALGPTFDRLWPVEDSAEFDDLLRAIDDAERSLETAARED
jgi:hypothetical protein